jgi:hypothetical protein
MGCTHSSSSTIGARQSTALHQFPPTLPSGGKMFSKEIQDVVTIKFKKKIYSASILKHQPLINTTFDHVTFRWTIPLSLFARVVLRQKYVVLNG